MDSNPFRVLVPILFFHMVTLSFSPVAAAQDNFGDRLQGLVYEAEEWSEPKDAWLVDRDTPNKWTLWTTEYKVV
jgi:hypothetical protein